MTEIQTKERTAEDILSYLIIEHGLTAVDPHERAYCLYTAKEVLELIIKELEYAYINTIAPLLDAGRLTSEDRTYRLEEVKKTVTAVDKLKLLRNEPDFYEKIARVPAAAFVKELGHDVLRDNLIEKIGIEKVHLYDTINLNDLKSGFLDKETAAEYCRASTHVAEYRIIKAEDSSAEVQP